MTDKRATPDEIIAAYQFEFERVNGRKTKVSFYHGWYRTEALGGRRRKDIVFMTKQLSLRPSASSFAPPIMEEPEA